MADLVYKKWITCAPVAFPGDEQSFFSRDTGLCCRALQGLGAEARVVLPRPARSDEPLWREWGRWPPIQHPDPLWEDEPDVQRVAKAQLCDPAFWRSQCVEAVIMYSWADPRYTLVAQAIRRAGLRLFLNMDTGGLISPFVESLHYGRSVFRVERDRWGGPFAGLAVASARLGWQILGLHNHRRRLRHMEASDIIGVVTPIAAERMRKYATRLGRGDLVDRIHFVPHPIDPALRHDGAPKEREVIAVGRWNDPVKRPDLLVAVARELLHRDTTVRVVIVGCDAIWCQARIVAGEPEWVDRVIAFERLDHDALCTRMNRARVSLCTSRSESFHAVSAEALLCGCSIVGPDDPALPALPYYVNEGMSGQLAATAEPANLAQTVLQELAVWERGGRSPHAIADTWHRRVASDSVVTNIDMLLAESRKLSRKT